MPVPAPFPYIPVHIMQTCGIGRETPYIGRLLPACPSGIVIVRASPVTVFYRIKPAHTFYRHIRPLKVTGIIPLSHYFSIFLLRYLELAHVKGTYCYLALSFISITARLTVGAAHHKSPAIYPYAKNGTKINKHTKRKNIRILP
jgi:hypothetical protein